MEIKIELKDIVVKKTETTNGYSGEKSVNYVVEICKKPYYFNREELCNLTNACRFVLNDNEIERT